LENKGKKNRKAKRKRRDCAATLSDLYPSTCLTWVALTGVLKTPASLAIQVIGVLNPPSPTPRKGDSTLGALCMGNLVE